MTETINNLDEALDQVLYKAREEYEVLSDQDVLKIVGDERQVYFTRYSMLKQLISSVESYLQNQKKLQQLKSSF
jgi:hypothetical protein